MEREIKIFTTPRGKKICIKTYLTGREANLVKEEMYKSMKIDVNGENEATTKFDGLSGSFILEQEKKLIGVLVVSIDGKTENILDSILDLHNDDYQAVVSEVNLIHNSNLTPAK